MILSLIVAASENNIIGREGNIPWNLPNDLKYFKNTTSGHPVIMGRKTHESIGRSLPDRLNIIVTRNPNYQAEECEVVSSLDDAITLAEKSEVDEVFIIGGGEIYKQALPHADRIYLTRVHTKIEGNVYFPEFSEEKWEEVWREEHRADEAHEFPFTFLVYYKDW